MPNGARSNSTCFSSAWCGAWSVAITSTVPSSKPVQQRVDVGRSRSGGFILRFVS